jgi:anti-anti-sigma regulatory factor
MDFQLRNLTISKVPTMLGAQQLRMTYAFEGELSDFNAYMLRNNMEKWFDLDFQAYTIDLKLLTLMDIAGVNFLVQLKEITTENNAELSVIVPFKKQVMETVYLTKLSESLNVEFFLDNED